MKTISFECKSCGVLMIIKYAVGDGGVKKIEAPEICQSCNQQINQSDVVDYIIEHEESLNENC